MKVLQTIPYMLAEHGGPSTCTCDMMDGLYDVGAKVDLLSSRPLDEKQKVVGLGRPWMKTVECDYKTPLALSKHTDEFLRSTDYDLYHANTLWLYPTHATCACARKTGKPYVLSPHGMLYPTALAVSSWKKRIMGALWYRNDVMRATCLHATCRQEMGHCRAYGYQGPIAVIPNAVVLPDYLRGFVRSVDSFKFRNGKRYIGFLGRLHPIKKVENIIYALDCLRGYENGDSLLDMVCLQIMGKFDDSYELWLKDEVRRLGLQGHVEFLGLVSGKDKYDRLANLSALMVPSLQENFGMIVPEALVCGTPVYASFGTPWEELKTEMCGWWNDNSPETIALIIKEILNTSEEQLFEMGNNGRKLIEQKYEQHKVATMMKQLYEWMVDEKMVMNKKPDFVYEKD